MKIVLVSHRSCAAVNKTLRLVEPKCKIQPSGAGEDETMFVRTS
ncbi:hypothetical protein [Nostoc sp. UHCC 0870]